MNRAPLSLVLLLLTSACDAPAELTVDLRTDWKPGVDFHTVGTELSRVPFDEPGASPARSVVVEVDPLADFVFGQRVAEIDDIPLGRSFVRLTLRDRAGATVARRVVDLQLKESYALLVVMTRNCRDVVCPGPGDAEGLTACLDGRCVDPRCTTATPEHCGEPSCAVDADCAERMECDGARCIDGVCLCDAPAADAGPSCPEGDPCDDGDACTVDDACAGDACAGTPLDCDDGNPCTDDSCDPVEGCVHTNNTAPCDDGDACTSGDACSGGTCAGSTVDCDDGNPCTDDSCDPGSGCRNTSRPEHGTCGAAHMRCCGGSCVDIRTDPSHCSGCGQRCAAGRACVIYDGQPACDCVANSECHGGTGQLCSTSYDLTCACTSGAGCVGGQTCVDRPGSTNYCTY